MSACEPPEAAGGESLSGRGHRGRGAVLLVGCVALLVLVGRVVHLAWTESPTFDEPKHLSTGIVYLDHGWCCAGRDNTPLVALNALPLYLTGAFPRLSRAETARVAGDPQARDLLRWRYFEARLVNLLPLAVLILMMIRIVRVIWGPGTALAALVLLACSPNLAAYASLVSPDFQVSVGLFVATVVGSSLLVRGPSWRRILACGLAVGGAILAKLSALVLLPALPLAALVVVGRARQPGRRSTGHGRTILAMSLAGLIGLGTVLLVYELPGLFGGLAGLGVAPFDPASPETALLGAAASPPADLHYGLWGGIERVREITAVGFRSYFMGRTGHKFWLYYPVALALKTPLALLLASLIGLAVWVCDRRRRRWLLVPACSIGLLIIAAVTSQMCLGIRHLLPLLPWMIVAAAVGLTRLRGRARVLSALLLGWVAFSGLRWHPHELAYFNELAGGPATGHRFLADANLDWGQDYYRLAALVDRLGRRDVIGILHGPFTPLQVAGVPIRRLAPGEIPHGLVAVTVTRNVGLGEQRVGGIDVKEFFAKRRPVAKAGHSIWLFDVE